MVSAKDGSYEAHIINLEGELTTILCRASSARARARPIPDLPPVMRIVRPVSFIVIVSCFLLSGEHIGMIWWLLLRRCQHNGRFWRDDGASLLAEQHGSKHGYAEQRHA